jgi:hypothetical protein
MRCHETCSATHRRLWAASTPGATTGEGGGCRRGRRSGAEGCPLSGEHLGEKPAHTAQRAAMGHVGGVGLSFAGRRMDSEAIRRRLPASRWMDFLPHSCSIPRPLSSAVLSPQPRLSKLGCCWPGAGSMESCTRHGGHGRCYTDLTFLRVHRRSSLTWQGRRPARLLCACPRPPVPKGCPWPPMPSSCFWPAPLAWPAGQKHSVPSIS